MLSPLQPDELMPSGCLRFSELADDESEQGNEPDQNHDDTQSCRNGAGEEA